MLVQKGRELSPLGHRERGWQLVKVTGFSWQAQCPPRKVRDSKGNSTADKGECPENTKVTGNFASYLHQPWTYRRALTSWASYLLTAHFCVLASFSETTGCGHCWRQGPGVDGPLVWECLFSDTPASSPKSYLVGTPTGDHIDSRGPPLKILVTIQGH